MVCAIFDFPINKMMACVSAKKFYSNTQCLSSKVPNKAAVPMDAGFLHDKAAMLGDVIKTHPVTQAWSVSSSVSLFTGNLLSHSSRCNHNVLLFETLMFNFLFLQSMNKVKYNQQSTYHFIVLHNMSFDG
jgi:hypothetical protein